MNTFMKIIYNEFAAGHTSAADLENCPSDLAQYMVDMAWTDKLDMTLWSKLPTTALESFFNSERNVRQFIRYYGRTSYSSIIALK